MSDVLGCLGSFLLRLFVIGMVICGAVYAWQLFFATPQEAVSTETVYDDSREIITDQKLNKKETYYYSLLSAENRELYHILYDGVKRQKEVITLKETDREQIAKIYQCMLMDHPELFWCEGSYESTIYRGLSSRTELMPQYSISKSLRETYQKQVDRQTKHILSGISKQASDYDKIQYIYETIIKNTKYDANAEHNQTIYSVLVNHRSVCAGYAKTTQYLLKKLGVYSTYVTGTIRENGGRHAWNLVWCQDRYYYVDTTWGDPVFAGGREGEDNIIYDFLCCSEKILSETHQISKEYPMPDCISMKDNYYVRTGRYYTEYDRDIIWNQMKQDIDMKQPKTVVKFADRTLFQEHNREIIDELAKKAAKRIAYRYRLSKVSYQIQDDEKLNKVVIEWKYE